MKEDAEGVGECVEDNDDNTWHVSNAVRRGLLGTDDTIVMSALPLCLACSSCVPVWSTRT